ncbi:hypothetical protein WAI453_005219 [Rhynchosporium graminicola]
MLPEQRCSGTEGNLVTGGGQYLAVTVRALRSLRRTLTCYKHAAEAKRSESTGSRAGNPTQGTIVIYAYDVSFVTVV